MDITTLFQASNRNEWRLFLNEIYRSQNEVWLVFPHLAAGEECVSYNDAVEEALCFGWIDGQVKRIDALHQARRFTPRREGSPYSRPNIERLIWLEQQGMLMPEVRQQVLGLIREPYVFPPDIIAALQRDCVVWDHYLQFTDSYKRIRVAYIDAARKRPEEFRKRLNSYVAKTREGKLISGFGGIDKYYS